jgi:hypothetical protein
MFLARFPAHNHGAPAMNRVDFVTDDSPRSSEAEMTLKRLRYADLPVVVAIGLLLNIGAGGASAAGSDWAWLQPQRAGSPTVDSAAPRDPLRGRIERLSVNEVKQFYLGCSGSAMRGLLDSAETALCSIGYDVLLNRHFGGDFHAFLAWSKNQVHDREAAIGD